MLLEEGSVFAERYTLKKLLGRGGFSEVWLAEDDKSGLEVALKVYAPYGGLDDKGTELFRKEFALVFNINQTNLLRPTYYDIYERSPYLILPYCGKGSVADLVGSADGDTLLGIIHDVAAGLSYLHSQDPPIIHQDIKPDNILINDHGDYVVSDFGISTKARSTLRKSVMAQESSGGTYAYMGPERFSKSPAPVKASDIWSLGSMAYELADGTPPFDNMGGLMQKNGAEIPDVQADIPEVLKRIIQACLAKDTWERPSAEDIVAWTDKIKAGETPEITVGVPETAAQEPAPAPAQVPVQSGSSPLPHPSPSPSLGGHNSAKPKSVEEQPKDKMIKLFKEKRKAIIYASIAVVLLVIIIAAGASSAKRKARNKEREKIEAAAREERLILLQDSMIDSSDPTYTQYDSVITDHLLRSAGYYTMQARQMLEREDLANDGLYLLEKIVDKGYKSSAEAAALLAYIYARKDYSEEKDRIDPGYLKIGERFALKNVKEDPQKSHQYSQKARQLDSSCYQACYELFLDFLGGEGRGAIKQRRPQYCGELFSTGLEAAREKGDTAYVAMFMNLNTESTYKSAIEQSMELHKNTRNETN